MVQAAGGEVVLLADFGRLPPGIDDGQTVHSECPLQVPRATDVILVALEGSVWQTLILACDQVTQRLDLNGRTDTDMIELL